MDPITRLSTAGASGVASGYPPGDYWIGNISNATAYSENTYGGAADSSGNTYTLIWVYNNPDPTYAVLIKRNNQGVVQWAKKMSDSSVNVSARGVYFDGTYVYALIAWQSGFGETIVLKFDTSGTLIWQKAYRESVSYGFNGETIIADSSGNIYVSGRYVYSGSYNAAGVFKVNSSGTVQWAKGFYDTTYGTTSSNVMSGLAILSTGDVIASGSLQYNSSSFYKSALLTRLSASNGAVSWKYQWKTTLSGLGGRNNFQNVAVDSSNNIFTVFKFDYSSFGNTQYNLWKLNSSGTFQSEAYTSDTNGLVYIDANDNVYANASNTIERFNTNLVGQYTYYGLQFLRMARPLNSDVIYTFGTGEFTAVPFDGGLAGTYTTPFGTRTYTTSSGVSATSTPSSAATRDSNITDVTPTVSASTNTVTVSSDTFNHRLFYLPPYP